jgi:hypothetical protein
VKGNGKIWIGSLIAASLAFSIVLALTRVLPITQAGLFYDFRAFYCAGQAANTGADPYRSEPLRSCEHVVGVFRSDLANLAVPAPLPGFALAPFRLLAYAPYPMAESAWLFLSLSAIVVAAFTLVRLSGLAPGIIWPALLLLEYSSIFLGQVVMISLAALILAALALERRSYALAALAASVAAIEPHIALASIVGLALFAPRTRFALAGLALAGTLLSLAILGINENIEYLHTVLPAHAASEIANEEQYGLAFALHHFGFSVASALRLADLSYVAALVIGLASTRSLVLRGAPVALYVLLPPLFILMSSPFLHIHQMAFALPAAAILRGRVIPNSRLLSFAILLLAVPWGAFAQLLPFLPLVAAIVFILSIELLELRWPTALLMGLAGVAIVLVLVTALVPRPDASAALAPLTNGHLLAEATWKAFIDIDFHSNLSVFTLAKIPTLLAVLLVTAEALLAAFMRIPYRMKPLGLGGTASTSSP